jgi:uncharacterized Zn-binding protein involved in type VI secretion
MRPIILINDPTASGGTVIRGSDTTTINSRAVARVGNAVGIKWQ